jgi:hypothetical protein
MVFSFNPRIGFLVSTSAVDRSHRIVALVIVVQRRVGSQKDAWRDRLSVRLIQLAAVP